MIYGLDYNCSRLKGMLLTGVQVYRKFYTKEKEMSNGVLAISVSKLPLQPYNLLAGMLFVSVFLSAFLDIHLIVWIGYIILV